MASPDLEPRRPSLPRTAVPAHPAVLATLPRLQTSTHAATGRIARQADICWRMLAVAGAVVGAVVGHAVGEVGPVDVAAAGRQHGRGGCPGDERCAAGRGESRQWSASSTSRTWPFAAWLLPVSVDGTVAAASVSKLWAARSENTATSKRAGAVIGRSPSFLLMQGNRVRVTFPPFLLPATATPRAPVALGARGI